jgi:rod shape-determining protein MreC
VQVNRNGLRAIASGTGNPERLELRHVADTADIKEGDLLVSSGLGQRFPAGYPVATVKEVIHDSGQPFAIVRAVPTAALNRSRYLLLVFSDGRSPEERAAEAAQAQESAEKGTETGAMPATGVAAPATVAPVKPGAAAPVTTAPVKPGTSAPATHGAAAPAATPAAAPTHSPASPATAVPKPPVKPASKPPAKPAATTPPAAAPANSRERIDG